MERWALSWRRGARSQMSGGRPSSALIVGEERRFYHQPGVDLLTKVPVDSILFASEMIGAVRGIDPGTGH